MDNDGFNAYGSLRAGDPTKLTTDRTFTGQKADGTGLLYYNARYYDPALGTFISPDTLVPDAGAVVDYNRFAYARNNPLKFSDPSGHEPQCDVGESSCDQQWALWRQYEKVQDKWSSWDDFLAGYGSYQNYSDSPDSYYADWLTRARLIEGDYSGASQRLALAEGYSESVLREAVPAFFDSNYPLDLAFQLNDRSQQVSGLRLALYGPFFRYDPPNVARQNIAAGEIKGAPPRNFYQSDRPAVQAYTKKLPNSAISPTEFYTNVPPDSNTPSHRAIWTGPRPGVIVKDGIARISCIFTRCN